VEPQPSRLHPDPRRSSRALRGGGFVKRTPLRPVSKKRQKVNVERRRVQEQAWGPQDEWRCWFRDRPASMSLAGPCAGGVWGHEILKRSRAGSTDANLLDIDNQVPLCNLHNSWVEDHPDKAHWLGLSRHAWDKQ
jgi:hypothetical protein